MIVDTRERRDRELGGDPEVLEAIPGRDHPGYVTAQPFGGAV